jgi:beta-N-acetylhexosaminidase
MLKRVATVLLWILAPVVIFVSGNLNDPYLVPIRGRGDVALLIGEFAVIAALIWSGYWRRGGIAGKWLVLVWP